MLNVWLPLRDLKLVYLTKKLAASVKKITDKFFFYYLKLGNNTTIAMITLIMFTSLDRSLLIWI